MSNLIHLLLTFCSLYSHYLKERLQGAVELVLKALFVGRHL